MASSYSPLLRLELIGAGEQSGLWGETTNKNLGTLLEQAIAGVTTVSLSGGAGTYTLSTLNGTQDESRSAVLKFIGNPSGDKIIEIPAREKLYVARNDSGRKITFKTAAQISNPLLGGVELLNGEASLVFCDGNLAIAGIQTAAIGTLTVAGGGTGATSFTGGFIKSPGGTGSLTSSSTVNAASEVSGILPVANGGTGASSFTSGRLLVGNGSGTLAVLAGSSAGQVPTWDGTQWLAATPAGGIATITGNSPITASVAGSAASIGLTSGTQVGQVLTWSGSSWSAQLPAAAGVSAFNGRTGAVAPASSDYSSFYPSLTGSGASGTWGISISGSAASASTAGSASSVPWTGVSGKPTTITGFASDAVSTSGSYSNPSWITSLDVSKVTNAVTLNTSQTITNTKSFTGGIFSQAYNFATFDSIYKSPDNKIVIAIGNISKLIVDSVGNVLITGTLTQGSDPRIKDNIQDYTKGLNVLKQIKVRSWDYNGKAGTQAGKKAIGVVATEIEQVMPEMVMETSMKLNPEDEETTNIKVVDSLQMTWLLVKSVQELTAKVESLEAQLAAK